MSGAEGDLWRPAADHEMAAHVKNRHGLLCLSLLVAPVFRVAGIFN
jgi:hypothetical protein